MSELAADGIPVAVTCRVLNIARQPYYRWLARPVTDADLAETYRSDALLDAHRDDPEFGYRFLADEARAAGQAMTERTAWKICSGMGWWSAFSRKPRRGKGGRPGPPVHDDLVKRDFTADGPNRLWLADITEHRTGEGKLYLCARSRTCGPTGSSATASTHAGNRGWPSTPCTTRSLDAVTWPAACCTPTAGRNLQPKVRPLAPPAPRDRIDGQSRRSRRQRRLESFFGLLQNNVLDRRTWTTRQQLRTAIVTWIERTYHRRRQQRSLSR